MKLSQYLLWTGLVSTSSAFWPSQLLSYLGLSRSKIPRFIREINHPFINDNRNAIESLSDPTTALCDPDSSLREHLPEFPEDLFRRLTVDNNKVSRGRRGWTNALEVLSDILDCKAAFDNVEEFEVDIFLHRGEDTLLAETTTPSREVLDLFVQFFANTPGLTSLTWVQPSTDYDAASAFERYFLEHNVKMPSVKNMSLGPNMQFLLAGTPHLKTLISCPTSYVWTTFWTRSESHKTDGPQFNFVRSIAEVNDLKEFGLHATWTPELVAELQQNAAGLEKLDMQGDLDGRWAGENNLGAMAKELNQFDNLRELRLPHVIYLGLEPYDGPDCGNAYFGAFGRVLRRQEEISFISNTEKAARIVLSMMPRLEVLCIGGECTKITLGKVPEWRWTGRLREYMLQEWPRWDGNYGGADAKYGYRETEDPEGPLLGTWEEDKMWFGSHQEL